MKPKAERRAEYARIAALLEEAEAQLKRYPGVRSVAVGLKETADKATDEIVFRVYVEQKKPPDQLPPGAMIPEQVLGVRTDVVLYPTPELTDDDAKYRPLMGGIQIGNDSSSGIGTLGCIAQLTTDNSIVILGNEHVMMAGGATTGEKIGQPTISCCCCCKGNIIGEVVNSRNDALVDCAIARITGQPGFTNEINEIGLVFGSAPLNSVGSTVDAGDAVKKVGRTSGLTTGTVLTPSMSIGTKTNQIEVKPDPGVASFQVPGDSGAVLVNSDNVVVGLLWATDTATKKNGYANLITNVTSALSIAIINSGTAGTIPLGSLPSTDELAETGIEVTPLHAIAEELRQSELGRSALALFDKHGHEINKLISTNREVKVAWHRFQGPAFTAHLIQSAKEPGHRIPSALDGVSPANLLIRMSVVLQEQGSSALASAVEASTVPVLNLVSGAETVREILDRSRRDVVPGASAVHAVVA